MANEARFLLNTNEEIKEKDIMKTKKNMRNTPEEKGLNDKSKGAAEDAHFGLPDEMEDFIDLNVEDDEILDVGNFLQKLHLRNHKLASKETIHEVYRTEEEVAESELDMLSEEDKMIINEVRQAVAENDIISLRANLQSISQNISAHKWQSEDIEDFLSGDLDKASKSMIENELLVNLNLANDIKLHREINEAIEEQDIMLFRSNLKSIIEFESSHNRSVSEIEDYINQELEEPFMCSFEEELMNNEGLAAEVRLSREINDAIGEKDIMALREKLKVIKAAEDESESKQLRGITPLKLSKVVWYAAVASVLIVFGLNITFQNQTSSPTALYNEYYRPVDGNPGITRSVALPEERLINQALLNMNNKQYDKALGQFNDILAKDDQSAVGNFYTGAIYQQKGQFDKAIQYYTNVIKQQDNLFVEQSEWYIGLCYLNRNEKEKAIRQFKKIAWKGGYYQQQSNEILKKLE
jgi:tetratricopeptide (TPR) repeat protein